MYIEWLSLASSFLLLFGIPYDGPYSYYIFLRWFICIAAIIVAIDFSKSKLMGWTLTFGIIAFLFNPLFPMHLDKITWIVMDAISAMLFLSVIYSIKNK